MNDYDFGRSFLGWTGATNNHTPRLQVAATCVVADADGATEFFLSEMCVGEQMYAEEGLIHRPVSEFAMVCVPGEQYAFMKFHADEAADTMEAHRVGEAMTTHDGRGAPITEMHVRMARHARVREVTAYGDIREAILGCVPMNGRTEFSAEDGATRVTLNYPIKICNIAHGRERWQVDTGPILFPDFAAACDLPVGRMRPAYLVFNTPDRAEVAVRRAKAGGRSTSHFHDSRRIETANHLYAAD